MLYVIYGNDTNKVRDKARKIVSALRVKKPDATYIEVEENVSNEELENYAGAQGLFVENFLVLFDGVLKKAENREIFLKYADNLASSSNVFVVLEDSKITAEVLNKFKKIAEKIEEHSVAFKNGEIFDNFLLADALGSRDRKKLWTLFVQASTIGVPGEELIGVLFWQMKAIYQCVSAPNISDSGLKPFVYTKAGRFAKNFSKNEIVEFLNDLAVIYHRAHNGEEEMNVGLERFILNKV